MVGIQMVSRLELVHDLGILHRDIKPGNFIMGKGDNKHLVYIIDFGLSSMYIDDDGNHVKFKKNVSFRGTHRYASINSHKRIEPSRRDDLEALGYVLIYFLSGNLPWQNLKAPKKDRRKIIGDRKEEIPIKELTFNLPREFEEYMSYVRSLRFKSRPDYEKLVKLFRDCLEKNNLDFDFNYDWTVKKKFIDLMLFTIIV